MLLFWYQIIINIPRSFSVLAQNFNEFWLIWFNYRIIHRTLGTNKRLHMSKVKNSPLCSICAQEPETIKHIFFYCTSVLRLWEKLSDWIFEKSGKRMEFNVQTVIFGFSEKDNMVLNLIIPLVKKYIFQYSRKNVNIDFNNVLICIHNYYILEGKLTELTFYQRKWSKWKCLFNEWYLSFCFVLYYLIVTKDLNTYHNDIVKLYMYFW